jgi:SNF2 family DNA or RNA helicase
VTAVQYVPQAEWQQWQQPALLLGDLTDDGTRIALVASADSWDEKLIAQRLKRLTPLAKRAFVNGQPADGMYVPATWAAVVQLGFTFSPQTGITWTPAKRLTDWITAETIRRTSAPPALPHDLYPPGLQLRPYQEDGAALIADEGRFLLLDDMGIGKTITTICGVEARRRAGTGIFPLVVVVPSWDVGNVWAAEIRKWAPAWGEPVFHKGPGRHEKLLRRDANVYITTYATARIDAPDADGPLVRLRAAAMIADEIHLAKNNNAKQSKAIRRISRAAGTVAGLSGTPVTQNTGDIYPMLEAMDPRSWPDRDRMVTRYCERMDDPYEGDRILGLNRLMEPEFRAVLLRNYRRVAKEDVLADLPPKIWSVRQPEIPAEWMKAYRQMEDDMLAQLPDGSEMSVMDLLTQLTRLSQLASCAADVALEQVLGKVTKLPVFDEVTGLPKMRQVVTLRPPSWKAESLMGIIAERRGRPVVAFTESRQLAMITGKHYCEPAGLRTGYITGPGDGITGRTREKAVEDFQAGKLDVIVCTAGAGSLGITLTASNTCVMLQRPVKYDAAVQSEDRLHRIGQEASHVEIIDIVAQGENGEKTVDGRRREILRDKAGMLAEFVQDMRIVRMLLGGLN